MLVFIALLLPSEVDDGSSPPLAPLVTSYSLVKLPLSQMRSWLLDVLHENHDSHRSDQRLRHESRRGLIKSKTEGGNRATGVRASGGVRADVCLQHLRFCKHESRVLLLMGWMGQLLGCRAAGLDHGVTDVERFRVYRIGNRASVLLGHG